MVVALGETVAWPLGVLRLPTLGEIWTEVALLVVHVRVVEVPAVIVVGLAEKLMVGPLLFPPPPVELLLPAHPTPRAERRMMRARERS